MSTNCLVTKLKGTVDNSELTKLGELKIRLGITPEGSLCTLFGPRSVVTVRSDKNALKAQGSDIPTNQLTSKSDGYTVFTVTEECNVFITNIYRTSYVELYSVVGTDSIDARYLNINTYIFADTTIHIKTGRTTIKIPEHLKYLDLGTEAICDFNESKVYDKLVNISMNNTNFNNDINITFVGNNIPNLVSLFSYGNKIYGDFSELGKCTKLERIIGLTSPNITGSLEGFALNAISTERTTGEISINYVTTPLFDKEPVNAQGVYNFKWRPTQSLITDAVADVYCTANGGKSFAIDASGNNLGSVTPW